MTDLTGQVCLITGAARGIGAEIAQEAAAAGAAVAINYNASAAAATTLRHSIEERYQVPVMTVAADISDAWAVDGMFAQVESKLGPVDLLVNNAGISQRGLLIDTTDEEWEKVMSINLRGPFLCCRRALAPMIQGKYGRIVNIASVWGIRGAAYESIYAAAKGGMIALTKSLAREMGTAGITVNAIAPGPVMTEMLASGLDAQELRLLTDEIPAGRLGHAKDIAAMCVFLLSKAAGFINGEIIVIDGGWSV